jgi:hypothetical protein
MTAGLIEQAVDALIAHFEGGLVLQLKLEAIETELSTSLPPIARYSKSEVLSYGGGGSFPLLEVLGERSVLGSNDGPGQVDLMHDIAIVVSVREPTVVADDLRERLYRYTRAIFEVIKEGRGVIGTPASVGSKAYTIQWGDPVIDVEPGGRQQLAAESSQTNLGRAAVNVRMHRQEVM